MKQRFNTQPDPELLFIASSSRDRRGKRVGIISAVFQEHDRLVS